MLGRHCTSLIVTLAKKSYFYTTTLSAKCCLMEHFYVVKGLLQLEAHDSSLNPLLVVHSETFC